MGLVVTGTEIVPAPDGVSTIRWSQFRRSSMVLLFVIYVGLSFINDPGAYLGTDTGGKVLTLYEMTERGSATDLDIGYWASEWDPEGTLHPYFGTRQMDAGWIQVTTVPMVIAGYPLYALGGYRLVLLIPMLGGIACAAAARRLARMIGATAEGQVAAFWLVGLAGAVVIYSLDFWEHTLGLAAMAWATIALMEAADRPRARRLGFGVIAGLLWGMAFSLRTESLVYGLVMTATLLGHRGFVQRRLREAVETGLAVTAGLVGSVGMSIALERVVRGSALRAGRAESTVSGAGADVVTRLREGLVTTFGLGAGDVGVLFGISVFVLISAAVWLSRHDDGSPADDRPRLLVVVALVPAFLYLSTSFGFVPGLFMTAPGAIAGAVLGRHGPGSPVVWGAIASLPVVWAFQYTGGAGPQWGGRYTLMSSFVFTVTGAKVLPAMDRVVRGVLVFGSVAITVFGLVWMSVRTHDVADAGRTLRDRGDQVVVASRTAGFLPREFVPSIAERRWLKVTDDRDLERASEIVSAVGDDDFAVLLIEGTDPEARIGAYRLSSEQRVRFVSGLYLVLAIYER